MTLVTRSGFTGKDELRSGDKGKMVKAKKDLWINEAGKIGEATSGLPKGWAKGKLLARAGAEITDQQAKQWKITTKAKKPSENKGK